MDKKNKDYQEVNLTNLWRAYKEKGTPQQYKILCDEIMKYAYNFPQRVTTNALEHGGAFALSIVDKIPRLVDKFVYYGHSFEGYLYITFKYQFSSYIKKYNKDESLIKDFFIINNFRALDMPVCVYENSINYSCPTNTNIEDTLALFEELLVYFTGTQSSVTYGRRLWIFLLKHSSFLQDQIIFNLAEKVGISETERNEKLSELAEHREVQRNKKYKHEQYCQQLFAKIVRKEIYFNKNYDLLSKVHREHVLAQIDNIRNTFRKHMTMLQTRSYCVPNSVLAKVLKVPKSTIDTSIYQLKQMCKKYNIKQKDSKHRGTNSF